MEEAAEYARQRELDGLIAVGGGSALDTCKAVNLLTTYRRRCWTTSTSRSDGDGRCRVRSSP